MIKVEVSEDGREIDVIQELVAGGLHSTSELYLTDHEAKRLLKLLAQHYRGSVLEETVKELLDGSF